MDKIAYREYLKEEVYKGSKNLFIQIFNKWFSPTTNAVYLFRKMQYLRSKKFVFYKFWTRKIQLILVWRYGIIASPDAVIGKGLRFVHPTSIVIGSHVIAGENLSLYQNVTLGGLRAGDVNKGNQPIIGNNVTLFANSLILGNINVGDNVIIGANSLLLKSVPDGSVCVGSPAVIVKIVSRKNSV